MPSVGSIGSPNKTIPFQLMEECRESTRKPRREPFRRSLKALARKISMGDFSRQNWLLHLRSPDFGIENPERGANETAQG
jgi:hypothetical protein